MQFAWRVVEVQLLSVGFNWNDLIRAKDSDFVTFACNVGIGRSPDLAQFVKHGKEGFDSYTEVDLLRSDTIVCVRRTINSDNKGSKWLIDGKKAAEKDVKAIMVELAIDVDNLCSFMPQDKVTPRPQMIQGC